MNRLILRPAVHLASLFAVFAAVFMLLPAAADLYIGHEDWQVFVVSAFFVGGLGAAVALATHSREPPPVSPRFGFLLVNLIWSTVMLAGAVPFLATSIELSLADAVFESMSALTTTGSTVLVGLDNLPPGLLLWRSLLQWIGGLGVVALGLFILPFLNIGWVSYLKIESSDISERPFARFQTYMIALAAIYAGLTMLCAIAYALAGMSGFDAINHAMTTLATGGFSTHDASFGFFADKPAILWIATFFMFLAGLPFAILIMLFVRARLDAFMDPQIRVFAAYCLVFSFLVAVYWRLTAGIPLSEALTHSAFNFVSIITTTGYASSDYSTWGPFVVAAAFVATFLGGCAGSTSGGIKAYRFLLLYEMLVVGLRRIVYPSMIAQVHYGDRPVEPEMPRGVALFIASFFVIWAATTILLASTGLDLVTATSGALTALTNVGPGLGDTIGPAGNFASLSDAAKWVCSVAMLLGRLEILPVLVVLSPLFWSR